MTPKIIVYSSGSRPHRVRKYSLAPLMLLLLGLSTVSGAVNKNSGGKVAGNHRYPGSGTSPSTSNHIKSSNSTVSRQEAAADSSTGTEKETDNVFLASEVVPAVIQAPSDPAQLSLTTPEGQASTLEEHNYLSYPSSWQPVAPARPVQLQYYPALRHPIPPQGVPHLVHHGAGVPHLMHHGAVRLPMPYMPRPPPHRPPIRFPQPAIAETQPHAAEHHQHLVETPIKIIRTTYEVPEEVPHSQQQQQQQHHDPAALSTEPYTTVMTLPNPLAAIARSYSLLAIGAYNMAFRVVSFFKEMLFG